MALPMVSGVYLDHLWRGTTRKLRALARPLLKDGIGDRMDKGNLWVVPGFTLLVFGILWTTKLSKIALEESTCHGASIYDFGVKQLEDDAKSFCRTGKRYYVGPDEAFSHDHNWRQQREVKNPEWILWFWAPIVFVMYVLTRFMWTLLLENQGINFANVVAASQSITVEHDGITELDEEKLADRLPVIVDNFRCSYSSRAYSAFLAFECALVVAPLLLLLFVLPLMIGGGYRTWGLDIARAWWERRDWQGAPLLPFYDASGDFHEASQRRPVVPLIPRITYCDYHFVSLGNSHTLTYRCYMDANWHERTALFTWIMLLFLAMINLGNLIFWLEWTVRMRFRHERGGWVVKKWLNSEGFTDAELDLMRRFAESFKMGQLLYFYYIEAHTDRVVASAFCTALFARWLEERQRGNSAALVSGEMPTTDDDDGGTAKAAATALNAYSSATTAAAMPLMLPQRPIPTAPCPTSPSAASFSDASTALMKRGGTRLHSNAHSPHSSLGDGNAFASTTKCGPLELALTTPSISALVGRQQARSPNLAIEIGRRSLCHGFEEEQRRAERRQQAEERRRTEQEEAQKTNQQQKEDKSSSSSISSDSSQDDDEDAGGVVTKRVPKNLKTLSGTVTERRAPLVVEEEEQQREQQQHHQQQNETAKRKQSKEKSPPGKEKVNGGGASDDGTKCDSAGKASVEAPEAVGQRGEAAAAATASEAGRGGGGK
uniref:Innexin n=1 Tax=Globodera rostochiensis TaxID=31243 RepID=A0A914HMK1_GLORO